VFLASFCLLCLTLLCMAICFIGAYLVEERPDDNGHGEDG